MKSPILALLQGFSIVANADLKVCGFMIDFQTVTKEFRSLIARRQELITFLGSVFAASGVFLENTLQGSLPESLSSIEEHIFFFYAVMIMVPSLILALRMARLHANGSTTGNQELGIRDWGVPG